MKSKFFKDTQGLCEYRCPPDQVLICLRMDKAACQQMIERAGQLGLTSGEYIQRMMEGSGLTASGSGTPLPSESQQRRFLPAPAGDPVKAGAGKEHR